MTSLEHFLFLKALTFKPGYKLYHSGVHLESGHRAEFCHVLVLFQNVLLFLFYKKMLYTIPNNDSVLVFGGGGLTLFKINY